MRPRQGTGRQIEQQQVAHRTARKRPAVLLLCVNQPPEPVALLLPDRLPAAEDQTRAIVVDAGAHHRRQPRQVFVGGLVRDEPYVNADVTQRLLEQGIRRRPAEAGMLGVPLKGEAIAGECSHLIAIRAAPEDRDECRGSVRQRRERVLGLEHWRDPSEVNFRGRS